MEQTIPARRIKTLVDGFDRRPAYAGLAEALMLVVGDGRIPVGARLPSERDLMAELGLSRTTVTRAYAALREAGYAEARVGAGTFAVIPGGWTGSRDRTLLPRGQGPEGDVIDLNCAAGSAPPEISPAYAAALAELPAYLSGHGYFPTGLPVLQEAIADRYARRGLPTEPEQIIVTPGALASAAVVARAFTNRGDRVVVESPVYPNAVQALRDAGGRLVETVVDPEGWDVAAMTSVIAGARARLAYLIPDFHNPTGHVMTDAARHRVAAALRRAGTVPVVDEAHQALLLDTDSLEHGQMPPPFAAHHPGTITLGSASKSWWGGLRIGWIRAPREAVDALTHARVSGDLGTPVAEQLVLAHLLTLGDVSPAHLARLREQRDALCDAVAERLPEWEFRRPAGGLALWCRLPRAAGSALARAGEAHGVIVAPGPLFAVNGGLERFVRVPWTRSPDELETAVDRLAAAWATVGAGDEVRRPGRRDGRRTDRSGRILVA